MHVKESEIQRQIIDGLQASGAEVIITHNSKYPPVTRGVTDIIAALKDGRTIYIEVKAPGGKIQEEQASFMARLFAKGHTVLVANGWDDVARYL